MARVYIPLRLKVKIMPEKLKVGSPGSAVKYGEHGTGLSYKSIGNDTYDALYKANPYVGLTYRVSPFQSFLSSLGFRTDYDRFVEEAQANSAEYDAQIASIKQQNEYNSPAQEAQRMRQAGLNPDLTGVQGVAESASPIQDPQGMSPGSNESGEFGQVTQMVWNFGTSIMRLYQVGVGLAKDMLSYKQLKNAVDEQDVGLAKEFMTFADEHFKKSLPDRPFANDDEEGQWLSNMSSWSLDYPKKMHFNRRQRKIWHNSIAEYANSDNFRKMMEDYKASSDAMTGYARNQFKPFRVGREGVDEWETFSVVSRNLGQLADDIWKMNQENQKKVIESGDAKAKYDKDFYNQLDASKQAGLQNTQASFGIDIAQIEKAMNSTLHHLVTDLERQANDGDLLSAGLLLAFQVFRMSNFKIK